LADVGGGVVAAGENDIPDRDIMPVARERVGGHRDGVAALQPVVGAVPVDRYPDRFECAVPQGEGGGALTSFRARFVDYR
jgi:hypothetical protein